MSQDLHFEGKKYISSRRAAETCGYAQDYIGQLIRGKKIDARMVGRSWFVSEESILGYKKILDNAPVSPAAAVTRFQPKAESDLKYSPDARPSLPELSKEKVPVSTYSEPQVQLPRPRLSVRSNRVKAPSIPGLSSLSKKVLAGVFSLSIITGSFWMSEVDNARSALTAVQSVGEKMQAMLSDSNDGLAAVAAPSLEIDQEPSRGFFASAAVGVYETFHSFFVKTADSIASLFIDEPTDITEVAIITPEPTPVFVQDVSKANTSEQTIVVREVVQDAGDSVPTIVNNYYETAVAQGASEAELAALQSQINTLRSASTINIQNVRNTRESSGTRDITGSDITEADITRSTIRSSSVSATDLSASGSSNLAGLTFGNATGGSATTTSFFTDILSAAIGSITDLFATNVSIVNSTTTNATSTNLYSDLVTVSGTISLQSATPLVTTNKLYANGTDLYWAGNVIGGSSTGNWTTNGTDAWRATGNVGVGTSSPFARLSVTSFNGGSVPLFAVSTSTGAGATSTAFIVDAYGSVGINTDNPNQLDFGGGVLAFKGRSNATTGSIVAIGNNVIGTNPIGRFAFIQEAAGVQTHVALVQALRSGGDDGADLNFMTKQSGGSLTEKMRITSDGKVGIGTSSPVALFTIASSTANSTHLEAIRISNSNPNGWGSYMFFERPGDSSRGLAIGEQYVPQSGLIPFIRTAGAISEELQIETAINNSGVKGNLYIGSRNFSATAGKIGVATTTPWASLSVAGLAGQTNPLFVISSSTVSFSTSTAFIVDSNGNTGIGTTSPLARLDVRDSAQVVAAFRGTNAHNTVVIDNLGGASFKSQVSFQAQGTEKWAIGSDINAAGADNFYIWNATGGRTPLAIDGTANTIVLSQTGSYKVGVGTTTPSQTLSVAGNGYFAGSNGSANAFVGLRAQNIDSNGTTQITAMNNAGATVALGIAGSTQGGGFANIGQLGASNALALFTNGAERIRIDTSGNVGIGTTTPAAFLDLYQNANSATELRVTNANSGTSVRTRLAFYSNAGLGTVNSALLQLNNQTNNLELTALGGGGVTDRHIVFTPAGSGNVGIGTTTPVSKLSVVTAGSAVTENGLSMYHGRGSIGDNVRLAFYPRGGTSQNVYAAIDGLGQSGPSTALSFITSAIAGSPTEKMRLDASGNLGIGTTSPSAKLAVQGSGTGSVLIGEYGGSNAYGAIGLGGSISATGYNFASSPSDSTLYVNRPTGGGIRFQENGTPQMTIVTGGNVGIGTTTPANLLHIGSGSGTKSVDPGVNLNRIISTGTGNAHGFSDSSTISRSGGIGYNSFDGRYTINGTADFDHTVPFQSAPTYSSSGTITNIYGLFSSPAITAGTVTNNYGAWFNDPQKSGGTLTNNYGIYVAPQTAGTNNYAAALMGKVGIGTATPGQLLEITGASPRFYMNDSGTSYLMMKMTSNTTQSGYIGLEGSAGGAVLTGSSPYAQVFTTGGGANPIQFGTNGVLRATISGTGNVGIGTTTPQQLLSVYGDNSNIVVGSRAGSFINGLLIQNDGSTKAQFTSNQATGEIKIGAAGTGGYFPTFYSSDSGILAERMRITTTGNVGIGTTTPKAPLNVYRASGDPIGNGQALFGSAGAMTSSTGLDATLEKVEIGGDTVQSTTAGFGSLVLSTRQTGLNNAVSALYFVNSNLGVNEKRLGSIITSTDGATNSGVMTFNTNNGGTFGEKMRITSTGNVGVGTTSPSKLLTVSGAAADVLVQAPGTGTAVRLILQTGAVSSGDGGGEIRFQDGNATTRSIVSSRRDSTTGEWPIDFETTVSGAITGTPKLRIAGNGNIGIGTTSPFTTLSVVGDILSSQTGSTVFRATALNNNAIAGSVYTTGNGASLQTWLVSSNVSGANGEFTIRDSTAGLTALAITKSTGNVGINTVSPLSKLDVAGTTAQAAIGTEQILTISRAVNPGVSHIQAATFSVGRWDASSTAAKSRLDIGLADASGGTPTNVMTLLSSGNVGIGTTTPAKALEINSAAGNNLRLTYNNTSKNADFNMQGGGGLDINLDSGPLRITKNTAGMQAVILASDLVVPVNGLATVGAGKMSLTSVSYGSNEGSLGFNTYMTSGLGYSLISGTKGFVLRQGEGGGSTDGALYFESLVNTTRATRMVIDTNGNIGIGTANPAFQLEIASSSPDTRSVGIFTSTSTAYNSNGDVAAGIKFNWYDENWQIGAARGAGVSVGSLTFRRNGQEAMAISTAGNVGIGTNGSTPTHLLSVRTPDVASLQYAASLRNPNLGGAVGLLFGTESNGYSAGKGAIAYVGGGSYGRGDLYFLQNSTADTSVPALLDVSMVIKNDGNVGIGTTSPTQRLSVQGNALISGDLNVAGINATSSITTGNNVAYRVRNTSGTAGSILFAQGDNSLAFGDYSNVLGGPLQVFTAGTEKLRITAAGNVGIGTTSPVYPLDVYGFINTNKFSGYKQDGNTILYASSTNFSTNIGISAGYNILSDGIRNIAIGYEALKNATSSDDNIAIGHQALAANNSGDFNIAIGKNVLTANTTGAGNLGIGGNSLFNNTAGSNNVALGKSALFTNISGGNNTAIGVQVLTSSLGNGNSALGYNALSTNTTGDFNTAMGLDALKSNSTGFNNTAIGNAALLNNKTGTYNTAVGYNALVFSTTGSNNVAVGKNALTFNVSATSTVAIGDSTAQGSGNYSNQNGTYVGYNAGFSASTGSNNNTFLGYKAGYGVTTGSSNVVIGYNVDAPSVTGSGQLNIGNLIYGTGIYSGGSVSSIPTSGSVGIGTSTPSGKLVITEPASGSISIPTLGLSGNSTLQVLSDGGKYGLIAGTSGSGNTFMQSQRVDGTATAYNLLLQPNGGAVGVGMTTNPSYRLQVLAPAGYITGFGDGTRLVNVFTESGFAAIGSQRTGDDLRLYVDDSSVRGITIKTSTGNIGIGTTTPISALTVKANSSATSAIYPTNAAALFEYGSGNAVVALAGSVANDLGYVFSSSNGAYDGIVGYSNPNRAMYFNTAGTEKVRITSGGNVGIGTTSPANLLSVQKTSQASIAEELAYFSVSDSTGYLKIKNGFTGDTGFTPVINGYYSGATQSGLTLLADAATDSGTAPLMTFNSLALGGAVSTRPVFQWQNNGSALMTVSASGNVGIGTTSPSAKLEIYGTSGQVQVLDSSSSGGAYSTYKSAGAVRGYVGGGTSLLTSALSGSFAVRAEGAYHIGSGGDNVRLTVASGGNVGVGTTSPVAKLGIQGAIGVNNSHLYLDTNGNVYVGQTSWTGYGTDEVKFGVKQFDTNLGRGLVVESSANGDSVAIGHNGTIGAISSTFGASGSYTPLTFWTNNTERVRVAVDGNVGIGTTSPAEKLNVSAAGGTIALTDRNITNASYDTLKIFAVAQNKFSIGVGASTAGVYTGNVTIDGVTGNFGVGTTSPSQMLSVQGNGLFSGNMSVANLTATGTLMLGNLPISNPVTNSLFVGVGAGILATAASDSNFFGDNAGANATNAESSNFFGAYAGEGATNAHSSNFLGGYAGSGATHADRSNFIGNNAGNGATHASYSNFLGGYSGNVATHASYSNFFGYATGEGATSASHSNFFGLSAGNGATDAPYSNFFGRTAGNLALNASSSNFFGFSAGNGATDAKSSNFLGYYAGYNAANASNSNFLGDSSGFGSTNASYSNFLGQNAGRGAIDAAYSNFLGASAGNNAVGATYSNFFGASAGENATNAGNSNFTGNLAGYNATNADVSNFIGYHAGRNASAANNSNFTGQFAGYNATNASYSNFIGNNAGNGATNAAKSIFIGADAGFNDTVNNLTNDRSSILIGNYTSTGGFSNSISIGQGTANSAADQLNMGRVLYATGIGSSTTALSSAISGGKVGIGTSTPVSTLSVQGSLCVRDTGSCGTTAGTIYATTAAITDIDLAENYPTLDATLSAGEIVAVDTTASSTIKRAHRGDKVLGIISTAPGLLLGKEITNSKPVALSGRVPVKVNDEAGNITIGDKIALSSTDGVGRKARGSEEVVGTALEAWSATGSSTTGLITVFVSTKQHFDADKFSIDENGNVGVGMTGTTTPGYKLQVMGDIAATSFVNISTRDSKNSISYLNYDDKVGMLEKIKTIGIATYRYNTESDTSPLRLGLIAEEAPAEILAVGGKGVDVYKLSTFILAGVQEMAQRLDDVTARVAAAEERIASLEAFASSTNILALIASSTTATTTASSTIDMVSGWLVSVGATIENNVARFVSVVADLVTTKKLTVGDSTNLAAAGITILDRVTGQPACVFVENGVLRSELGTCGTAAGIPAVDQTQPGQGSIDTITPPISTGGDINGGAGTTTPDVTSEDSGTTTPDVIGDMGGETAGDTGTTTPDGTGDVVISTPDPEVVPEQIPEPVTEPSNSQSL